MLGTHKAVVDNVANAPRQTSPFDKQMKLILPIILLLCFSISAHAETRIIGIKVTQVAGEKPKVSIFSDVTEENKKDISIADASKILSEANGWGSSVIVGVVADRVPVSEYIPLIESISKNAWLELGFIEGQRPTFIFDNIKKRIESGSGEH